jgi:hypothetical protein
MDKVASAGVDGVSVMRVLRLELLLVLWKDASFFSLFHCVAHPMSWSTCVKRSCLTDSVSGNVVRDNLLMQLPKAFFSR